LKAVRHVKVSSAETIGAFNTGSDTGNLHRPTTAMPLCPHAKMVFSLNVPRADPLMKRRILNLKANFKSSSSGFSFKRLFPGAFDVGLIGSTCTALP
jgi:hypothetical protein